MPTPSALPFADMVGKRLVGKQNVIPNVRDFASAAIEFRNALTFSATVDTERARYVGVLVNHLGGPGRDDIVMSVPWPGRNRTVTRTVRIESILAFRLDGVERVVMDGR